MQTEQPVSDRFRLLLLFVLASLLCLLVYWYGLRAGYQMDDFAWLGLHQLVHDWRTLLDAVFAPKAQGTIRPWSERLLFLAGWHFFGIHAGPIRVVVFATMFLALGLLGLLACRLTGRPGAMFLAPVLWFANPNLYVPLAWTAAYNQVLCAAFLLGATLLWIRFCDSGRRRWFAATTGTFILGMGALEINVVFPAIAAAWSWCRSRERLRWTIPLFAISAAYTLMHRAIAPPQRTEIYRMIFDVRIFHTIGTYLWWTVSADRIAHYRRIAEWPFILLGIVAGAAAIAALVWASTLR